MSLTGSCLCGAVQYEITAELTSAEHCYCDNCRKAHGAAFGTYSPVDPEQLHIKQGKEQIAAYDSSPGNKRFFCKVCGSTLGGAIGGDKINIIAIGTLDSPMPVHKASHMFVKSKPGWYEISDALPQHHKYPPPHEDD